ncbi:ras GTPase-activating protein-binding protein 2 [Anthonomus grandis grandis]|uniref:ras GTPase-activating protein-binding protein 2 n=1 Tax=Anthonomus grandis grandis TaxID=2921223 RepID=UPI002165706A|nr:ras GTPase-activating protein-binding protein 2 [Anthonomus grandis grandis]XP_050296423.1 ras GTPase-activating protein-binding protein 2 [Anthonomus grandis grandis]
MVMEAPPSPQSVGREFVRQYYTLLNKAPTHLHRFYNHQSSFIHGGLDPSRETIPVIGQKQIHQKIQQLNFRDCHAKITQVDSQSTLGGGVVVQVTGELSNAGQPMRRFTQTFVLASQSPKKYYVHNDIFRYQDEIISDEECDGEIRSEVEEECLDRSSLVEPQPSLGQPIAPAPGLPVYAATVPSGATALPSMNAQQPAAAPHQPSHVLPPQQPPQINQTSPPVTLNGHPDDWALMQGHIPQTQQPPLATSLSPIPAGMQNQPAEIIPIEEPQEIQEEPLEENNDVGYGDVAETELEPEIPQGPASNEPKTFANLFKNSSAGQNQSVTYQSQQPSYEPSPQLNNRQPSQTNGVSGRPSAGRLSGGPPPNRVGGAGPPRTKPEDGEDRRRSNFGQLDANQLFLGNLPHIAKEEELREIFEEFGAVLDLRIHSKPSPNGVKPQGGRAPPNYGFITYESQQSIVACLAARPIYYPVRDDSSGTQLNIEEKKNKDRDGRPSFGGNGPRPDSFRSGGRGDQSRRGMGPGGPRGSQGGNRQGQDRYYSRNQGNTNNYMRR